jgi:hypothetical protein
MNWYKIAITQSEFYDFYGYSSLTEESLKENPVLLYGMIEHLNYIREYYLIYLVDHINSELFHSLEKAYVKKSTATMTSEERSELEEMRTEIRGNFAYDRYTNIDFDSAIKIFRDYQWVEAYGGEAWAKISEWTQKLWEVGEIPQEKFSQSLFNKMQRLTMVIDTIHSLEHNTNKVLVELPESEREWMQIALEIVKSSQSDFHLLPLLENKKLKDQINKNRMVSNQEYDFLTNNAFRDYFKSVFEKYKGMRYHNTIYNYMERLAKLVANINNPQIIDILLNVLSEDKELQAAPHTSLTALIARSLGYNKIYMHNIDLIKKTVDILKMFNQSFEKADFITMFLQNVANSMVIEKNPDLEIIEMLLNENNQYGLSSTTKRYLQDILDRKRSRNI